MAFCVLTFCREPTNHTDDCYFWLAPPIKGRVVIEEKRNSRHPNIPSANCPIPHLHSLPVLTQTNKYESEVENEGSVL